MNAVPVISFYIGLTMFVYIYRSKQYWGLCCFSRFEIFQFLVFPVQAYQQVSFKLFLSPSPHTTGFTMSELGTTLETASKSKADSQIEINETQFLCLSVSMVRLNIVKSCYKLK